MKPLIIRDLRLIFRNPAEILYLIFFFGLFNFVISFGTQNISLESPVFGYSVIFSGLIFTLLISIRWIFERDYEKGILEQLYLFSDKGTSFIINSKILSFWVAFAVPIAVSSPIFLMFFDISDHNFAKIFICNITAGLLIAVMNCAMASLTCGVKNGLMLSLIISVPLYIPMIVTNISFLGSDDFGVYSYFLNSFGIFLIYYPLALMAGHFGIRMAVEE